MECNENDAKNEAAAIIQNLKNNEYRKKSAKNIRTIQLLNRRIILTPPEIQRLNRNMKIEGNDDFIQKTKAALSLIQEKDPKTYEFVNNHIEIIASGKASGIMVYKISNKYVVGKRTYNSDIIWYAGTIAHDAYHLKLYNDYIFKNPGRNVPDDVWTGREAEAKCLNFQYNVLKKIGASVSRIHYVKNVIGSNYWDIPYRERNW